MIVKQELVIIFLICLIIDRRWIVIRFEAVLFDLDGTLLDTIRDIADSMNIVLERFGFAAHPLDAYRYFIGDSVKWMITRALPENRRDEETIEKCRAALSQEYGGRWARTTKPYPDIPQLLTELQKRKIRKAILSNKPDEFTKPMVARLLPDFSFDIVLGVNPSIKRKPDPQAALLIAGKLGIPAEKFLYLGDTNTDMQTAAACGMYAVGALWGYRDADELLANGAKILVEKPLDVLKILDTQD